MEEEFKKPSPGVTGGVRESAPVTKESITPVIYNLVEELEKHEIELKKYIYEFATRYPALDEIPIIQSIIRRVELEISKDAKHIEEEAKNLFSDKEFLADVWTKYTKARSSIQYQIDEVKKWFSPDV